VVLGGHSDKDRIVGVLVNHWRTEMLLNSGLVQQLGFPNCWILLSSVWVYRSIGSLPIDHLASILTSYMTTVAEVLRPKTYRCTICSNRTQPNYGHSSWLTVVAGALNPVYTIQPVEAVVKAVVQPVWQPVGCLFTRCSRLSNRFDNRLYRVNGLLDCSWFENWLKSTHRSHVTHALIDIIMIYL